MNDGSPTALLRLLNAVVMPKKSCQGSFQDPEATQLQRLLLEMLLTPLTESPGDHTPDTLLVNRALVKWHSKRRTTVETSAFSSEFIAMKHCIKDIEFLRFKPRMFGIPLDGNKPENGILCDNEAVVKNSFGIESALDEKHGAVACQFTRWNVAAKFCLAAWIPTAQNVDDTMTKLLPEAKQNALFCNWVH